MVWEEPVVAGIQGGFLLSNTLYRECHCTGGQIHASQYILPMCPHFFWSLLHYSAKYAVCSSVSLFLKFTGEKPMSSLTFSLYWPSTHQLLRSLPMNPVSICSKGTNPSTSSRCSNIRSVPVVG